MPDENRSLVAAIRESTRRRRNVGLIGVAIAAVISAGIIGVIYSTADFASDGTLPAPTEITNATPTEAAATPTGIATPGDEPAYPAGSLPAMLAIAPDRLDDDDTGLPIEATYADLMAWFDAVGLDPSLAADAEIESAMRSLQLPGVLRTRGMSEEWRAVYGFGVRDVDQVFTVGHAPNQIVILRGDFVPDDLYDTWVRNGYQAVEVEEVTVWSLFPGDRIDLTAPASRPALGLLNNIVLLEDGTLVASATQSGMADVLKVTNGDEPSLLEYGDLAVAIAQWPEADYPVSAILADGTILQGPVSGTFAGADTSEGTAVATPLALSPLPPVELALFGLVPGEDPEATATLDIMMIYGGNRDAVAQVPAIVESRSEAAEPGTTVWADHLRLAYVEVVGEDEDQVDVRFEFLHVPDEWSSLIVNRELDLLAWFGDA